MLLAAFLLGPASKSAAAEDGFFEQDKLTGDWGGARKTLKDAGIDLGLNYVAETFSNPVGGFKQTTIYQGLLTPSLNLDLESSQIGLARPSTPMPSRSAAVAYRGTPSVTYWRSAR